MRLLLVLLMISLSSSLPSFYSLSPQFTISTTPIPGQLAHVRFLNNYQKTGWDQLYIYTSPTASPREQHRAAGYLQGYTTYQQIYDAYRNFVQLQFEAKEYAPQEVRKFLLDQLAFMEQNVKNHPEDTFWKYIGYYLQQVRYMQAGYMARVKKEGKPELELDFQMIYYLSSVGDLEDLIQLAPEDSMFKKNCNAYVRLDQGQLYTTHATHNRYAFLLRTIKFWKFPRQDVASQWTCFTSRPGDLVSKDDFFLLGSGLRVIQTSLGNENLDNLKELSVQTVPSWLRTLVANHLARTPEQWIKLFKKQRSGTHNNQWIVIDPSRIGQSSGVVTYFQQAFSLHRTLDRTSILNEKGYVAGYNTPITQQIYDKLGYTEPQYPTYDHELRGIILQKYHPKMTTIDDMKYWIINNEEEVPRTGLAPRYDMLEEKARAFGLTDCKIASENTIKENYFWAISGPSNSHGRFPPFDWRKWNGPAMPHKGLAQTYDFQWEKIVIDLQKDQL